MKYRPRTAFAREAASNSYLCALCASVFNHPATLAAMAGKIRAASGATIRSAASDKPAALPSPAPAPPWR